MKIIHGHKDMMLTGPAEQFLAKALGPEGLEELRKSELYKLQTNTVADYEEIRTALQIVPRTVLSFLHKELSPLKPNQGKEVVLPVTPEATLSVTKMSNDVYTGHIHQNGKIVAKFQNRTLPGIGLVVMSTFELYDVSSLAKMPEPESAPDVSKIQRFIDERLDLRNLVKQVVDQRISEREAIDHIIKMRLTQAINEAAELEKKKKQITELVVVSRETTPMADLYLKGIANGMAVAKEHNFVDAPKKKPLKGFLEKRAKKKQPEFHIEISKNETVTCPDCGKDIFSNGAYSGCICYGDDRNNKIYIKKTESGVSMRFPKSWDEENIQMLLETLRSKNRSIK